jgi:hypothetical protein
MIDVVIDRSNGGLIDFCGIGGLSDFCRRFLVPTSMDMVLCDGYPVGPARAGHEKNMGIYSLRICLRGQW